MVNILIADDNIFITDIILKLIIKNNDIKLLNICHDGDETLKDIYELKPDVCILDLDMPYKTGLEILDEVEKENINCKFIVFSGCDYLINKLNNYTSITSIINKGTSFDRLVHELSEISKEMNYINIKSEIMNTLASFHFNLSTSGTKYLIDCILLCLERPNYIKNLSQEVYPKVAIKNLTTSNKILWNINRSIKSMWRYTPDTEYTSSFFNLDSIRKPNVKSIISTFIDIYNK